MERRYTVDEKIWKGIGVFAATILLGRLVMYLLPLGYTAAALLYLSAVIATGCFWIGCHLKK